VIPEWHKNWGVPVNYCWKSLTLRTQGARDETGARGTFSGERGNLGIRRRTLFLGAIAGKISTGVKSKVFQTALKNDVLYVPGELCYADDPSRAKPNNEMHISFAARSEENMREGIRRLGKVLRKFLTQ
jgi:hypothetical protein